MSPRGDHGLPRPVRRPGAGGAVAGRLAPAIAGLQPAVCGRTLWSPPTFVTSRNWPGQSHSSCVSGRRAWTCWRPPESRGSGLPARSHPRPSSQQDRVSPGDLGPGLQSALLPPEARPSARAWRRRGKGSGKRPLWCGGGPGLGSDRPTAGSACPGWRALRRKPLGLAELASAWRPQWPEGPGWQACGR